MSADIKLNQEQEVAINRIAHWAKSPLGYVLSLQGVAGSGKTTLTKYLTNILPKETMWAATTGKAAHRLSQLAGVSAYTLHSRIYRPPFQNGKYLNFTMMKEPTSEMLVCDEASLISPQIWEDLDDWLRKGVKILFIGDGYQLPPVMTYQEVKKYGNDFTIFDKVHGPMLNQVMRNGDGVIDVVSKMREDRCIPTVGNHAVKIQNVPYPGLAAVKDYLEDPDDHVVITWTNKMRMQGNQQIRKSRKHLEQMPMHGEPVILCKNGQERLNGEVVYVDKIKDGPTLSEVKTKWLHTLDGQEILINVEGKDQPMDGFMPEINDWKLYHWIRGRNNLPEPLPITYGYVYTFDKIQGNQARRVTVYLGERDLQNDNFNKDTLLPDGSKMPFSIRALYTGLSRAQNQLTLYLGTS
jgi:exodeoxyribonuclease-5